MKMEQKTKRRICTVRYVYSCKLCTLLRRSKVLLVQLLLGSVPPTVAAQLGGNSLALRDVLRASACFIKDVYATRWTYGHKFHQRD